MLVGAPMGAAAFAPLALTSLDQPSDLLAEDLPTTAQDRADRTSYPDVDHDPAAIERHIRNGPDLVSVHAEKISIGEN